MFTKRAVILTNAIGPGFLAKSSQRDVVNALSWMGVSKIRRCGIGLLEGVLWEGLSEKRRSLIAHKVHRFSEKCVLTHPTGKSLLVWCKFMLCKVMHQIVLRTEETPSADNRHWIEQGWITGKAENG